MAAGLNCYKMGATLSLIIVMYVLVILPPNSVEAIRLNKGHEHFHASRSPVAIGCGRAGYEMDPEGDEVDPRLGVQKRLVPTGPCGLHN